MSHVVFASWLAALVLVPGVAAAQGDLVEGDPFGNDPIAVDANAGLSDVPRSPTPGQPGTAAPTPIPGNTLTAISGIREVEHGVQVQLDGPLARVETRMRFASRARTAGTVVYRLNVPEDSMLSRVALCAGEECTDGAVDGSDGAPLSASLERDGRGLAIFVRTPPVPAGADLSVRVEYATPVAIHGGALRLTLPSRGDDARSAPASFSVVTDAMLAPSVNGRVVSDVQMTLDPWFDAEISAQLPRGAPIEALAETTTCGGERCALVRVTAGAENTDPVDLIVAIDVSPSTLGPAHGRIAETLAALLAVAPPGSKVRAVAFAARAQTLFEERLDVSEVPLVTLARSVDLELGSATRFEALWSQLEALQRSRAAGLRPLLVVLGDGGITRGSESDVALRQAARAHVETSIIDVGERGVDETLSDLTRATRGLVVHATAEADEATHGRRGRLEERLGVLFAPALANVVVRIGRARIELGAIRAGESLSYVGPSRGTVRVEAGPQRQRARDSAMAALISPPPPLDPAASSVGRGVPAETVLSMLRQRVVPVARDCFRRDRAGRARYNVVARYDVTLEDREVVAADVAGDITDELRTCLLTAVGSLDVPRFEGRVVVRYPLYTEPVYDPPQIELVGNVEHEVDRVIGEPVRIDAELLRRLPGPNR